MMDNQSLRIKRPKVATAWYVEQSSIVLNNTWFEIDLSQLETLNASRFDNTTQFYAATVSLVVIIRVGLFNNANVIFDANVASSNLLQPSFLDNSNSFNVASVTLSFDQQVAVNFTVSDNQFFRIKVKRIVEQTSKLNRLEKSNKRGYDVIPPRNVNVKMVNTIRADRLQVRGTDNFVGKRRI